MTAITAEKRRLSILKIKELDALALKYQKVRFIVVKIIVKFKYEYECQ